VANIPVTGVSEALSRGVVDGTLGDWTGTFAFRVVDAADYHVDGLPLSLATAFVPINKATWERIPEAGKAAIEKHSGEAFARLAGAKLDGAAEGLRAQLDTMPGHTVVTLEGAAAEPFRALADEAVQSWIAEHPNGAALHAELTSYLESLR
jgi:TRAP-type C4-dicarboxylate transport system substrate-binding protein